MKAIKKLFVYFLSFSILVSNNACSWNQWAAKKQEAPDQVITGDKNVQVGKSPGAKVAAQGDIVEPGGIKAEKVVIVNPPQKRSWLEELAENKWIIALGLIIGGIAIAVGGGGKGGQGGQGGGSGGSGG